MTVNHLYYYKCFFLIYSFSIYHLLFLLFIFQHILFILFFFTNSLSKLFSLALTRLMHIKTWSYILAMVCFYIIFVVKVYSSICLVLYTLANSCFYTLFASMLFSVEFSLLRPYEG